MVFIIRNIGYITLKIVYFRYLEKNILDRSIQNILYLFFNTESLPEITDAPWVKSVQRGTRGPRRSVFGPIEI